jgi:peptidoglycan/LPS O-acetylase OafA/YrhL
VAVEGSERHKHPCLGEEVFASLGDASYSNYLFQVFVISGFLKVLIKFGWLPIDIATRIAVFHKSCLFLPGLPVYGHLASPDFFAAAIPVRAASNRRPHADGATH